MDSYCTSRKKIKMEVIFFNKQRDVFNSEFKMRIITYQLKNYLIFQERNKEN